MARFARLNDAESLAALVGPETAAILIEPVQGEGGIHPATPEFLAAARALADEHGALLIFDEVQCGTGRTGTFFAWEQLGVAPDALVLAKALANGLPIGALLVADGAPGGLRARRSRQHVRRQPGGVRGRLRRRRDDRRAAAALRARRTARSSPPALAALPGVVEVRGRGLLLGAELDRPAGPVVADCLAAGLLVGTAGDTVLRLTPPLTITSEELDLGLALLQEVLA